MKRKPEGDVVNAIKTKTSLFDDDIKMHKLYCISNCVLPSNENVKYSCQNAVTRDVNNNPKKAINVPIQDTILQP